MHRYGSLINISPSGFDKLTWHITYLDTVEYIVSSIFIAVNLGVLDAVLLPGLSHLITFPKYHEDWNRKRYHISQPMTWTHNLSFVLNRPRVGQIKHFCWYWLLLTWRGASQNDIAKVSGKNIPHHGRINWWHSSQLVVVSNLSYLKQILLNEDSQLCRKCYDLKITDAKFTIFGLWVCLP